MCADTFGVAIHVTDEEFRFVVHVPSSIDSNWSDPERFQSLVETAVWNRLHKRTTLERINATSESGDTVTLGTVTMAPDGTVIKTALNTSTSSS